MEFSIEDGVIFSDQRDEDTRSIDSISLGNYWFPIFNDDSEHSAFVMLPTSDIFSISDVYSLSITDIHSNDGIIHLNVEKAV